MVIGDREDAEGMGDVEVWTFSEARTNGSTCSSDIRDGSRGTSSGSITTGSAMITARLACDFGSLSSNASSGGTNDDTPALRFGALRVPEVPHSIRAKTASAAGEVFVELEFRVSVLSCWPRFFVSHNVAGSGWHVQLLNRGKTYCPTT